MAMRLPSIREHPSGTTYESPPRIPDTADSRARQLSRSLLTEPQTKSRRRKPLLHSAETGLTNKFSTLVRGSTAIELFYQHSLR